MTDSHVSILKVELFLIDNLKELPVGDGKFMLKAESSMLEFLEKLEKEFREGRLD